MSNNWVKVVFAGDCEEDECGELICAGCGGDYSECACPGPTMEEEYDYRFDENDVMWARKKDDALA